jgi:hypothetical protein
MPRIDPLNEGERWLYNWQFREPFGHFWTGMTQALEKADLGNLNILRKAFPLHVEALHRFRSEKGYWQSIINKAGGRPIVRQFDDRD